MKRLSFLILPLALLQASCGDSALPSETETAGRTADEQNVSGSQEDVAGLDIAPVDTADHARQQTPSSGQGADASPSSYQATVPGEPLSLYWEDLMPESAKEELVRQQEEFMAMLEKKYAANSTSLSDVDPYADISEGSEFDYMPQLGNFETVEELDGKLIRIPGYVVPFDFETQSRHREFLFVPYMGACIHMPPPPPNQVIFVKADPARKVEDIWAPYWLEGTLSTEKNENEVGDAAYSLSLQRLRPYEIP